AVRCSLVVQPATENARSAATATVDKLFNMEDLSRFKTKLTSLRPQCCAARIALSALFYKRFAISRRSNQDCIA
ncbi:hypothetical protein J8J20_23930, partial [Mycobacterium tuberculosis]|nr:hypothetical protein [Mycobacterium tuberculosis]